MNKQLLDSLVQIMRQQRTELLNEFRRAEEGLEVMAEERESELEEHAQEEQSARFLARLDDRTLSAVKEIDAALERIIKGTYGICETCHAAVSIDRLRSLPATRFCARCAAQGQTQPLMIGAQPERTHTASVPPDLNLLDDRELMAVIHEHLKEDGRIDMEELRVIWRNGVVYLSGNIPSEAEHQIVLHTLTDVLGFTEIIDHLDVKELLWETERRTREPVPEMPQRWEDLPGTEDVVESDEEGKEFVAPAKPPPDEQ
jgi:RNA polymerase-binding protein DksA